MHTLALYKKYLLFLPNVHIKKYLTLKLSSTAVHVWLEWLGIKGFRVKTYFEAVVKKMHI